MAASDRGMVDVMKDVMKNAMRVGTDADMERATMSVTMSAIVGTIASVTVNTMKTAPDATFTTPAMTVARLAAKTNMLQVTASAAARGGPLLRQ